MYLRTVGRLEAKSFVRKPLKYDYIYIYLLYYSSRISNAAAVYYDNNAMIVHSSSGPHGAGMWRCRLVRIFQYNIVMRRRFENRRNKTDDNVVSDRLEKCSGDRYVDCLTLCCYGEHRSNLGGAWGCLAPPNFILGPSNF